MAGYGIRIDSRKARRHLDEASQAALRMRQAFADIGELALRSVQANFDAEGRPQRWAGLRVATLLSKLGGKRRAFKRRGGLRAKAKRRLVGNKILTDTGRLRRSITYRARRDHVIVGSNAIYARAHQLGNPKTNLPARPYLLVQPEDRARFRRIIGHHITEAFTR